MIYFSVSAAFAIASLEELQIQVCPSSLWRGSNVSFSSPLLSDPAQSGSDSVAPELADKTA